MHAKPTVTRVMECVALCLEALPVAYWDHHEQYSTLVAPLDVEGEAQKKNETTPSSETQGMKSQKKQETLRICPRHAPDPRHLPTATAHETWMDSFHQREPEVLLAASRTAGQLDNWTANL